RLDGVRAGAAIGVLASVEETGPLALQTELTWVRKGGKGTLQGFEEPIAFDRESDYLPRPPLAAVRLPMLRPLRPVLLAGRVASDVGRCARQLRSVPAGRRPRPRPRRPGRLAGPAVSGALAGRERTAPGALAVTLGCERAAPSGLRRSVDWSWSAGGRP